jgi:signal transduction histidine kinase
LFVDRTAFIVKFVPRIINLLKSCKPISWILVELLCRTVITNALKHAHPTQIQLHLSATPASSPLHHSNTPSLHPSASVLTLRITDNGRGFDPTAQTHGQPGHFGCIGIRERARKVGAEVNWESETGKGTTVCVELKIGK